MKYEIEIDSELNLMLRNDYGLSQYFRNGNKRFYERYWDYSFHPHFHPKRLRQFMSTHGMAFLRNLIKDERSFDIPLLHPLFKSFVFSELQFIRNYIPQNSHEERLTGHIVSEIYSSLRIIKNQFIQKSIEYYDTELTIDFHYADLSSNNREKETGADLGIVFHINLPDYKEKVNVAILQAKKFNKSARIELNQLETINKYAGNSAFYLFYDMNSSEQNAPIVKKADTVRMLLGNELENQKTKSIERSKVVDGYDSVPLSIFLIFELLNPDNQNLKSFENLWDAKSFVQNQNEEFQVSKLLTVSIGGISKNQDLRDLGQLYNYSNYTDE